MSTEPTAAAKPSLHDWHRDTFTKRTDVALQWPERKTDWGGTTPAFETKGNFGSARAVVAQRIVNSLSPAEWDVVLKAFDASSEGQALESKHADAAKSATGDDAKATSAEVPDHVRREHAELWLLHVLYEGEHEDMVPATELALQKVLDHHAHPAKLAKHKAAVLASLATVKS